MVPSRIDQSANTDHAVVVKADVAHAEKSLIVVHATHALLKRLDSSKEGSFSTKQLLTVNFRASRRRKVLAPVIGALLRMNWPDRQKRLRMKIRRRQLAARHPKKPKKSHHQSQRRSPWPWRSTALKRKTSTVTPTPRPPRKLSRYLLVKFSVKLTLYSGDEKRVWEATQGSRLAHGARWFPPGATGRSSWRWSTWSSHEQPRWLQVKQGRFHSFDPVL